MAWEEVYSGIARAMWKRGLVDDDRIVLADAVAETIIAKAINAPREMIKFQIGGQLVYSWFLQTD